MLKVGATSSRPWQRVAEPLAAEVLLIAEYTYRLTSSSCGASYGRAAPRAGKRGRSRSPRSDHTWMASRTRHRACRGLGCGALRLERGAAVPAAWSPPCKGNCAQSRPCPNLDHHCRSSHRLHRPSTVSKVSLLPSRSEALGDIPFLLRLQLLMRAMLDRTGSVGAPLS